MLIQAVFFLLCLIIHQMIAIQFSFFAQFQIRTFFPSVVGSILFHFLNRRWDFDCDQVVICYFRALCQWPCISTWLTLSKRPATVQIIIITFVHIIQLNISFRQHRNISIYAPNVYWWMWKKKPHSHISTYIPSVSFCLMELLYVYFACVQMRWPFFGHLLSPLSLSLRVFARLQKGKLI